MIKKAVLLFFILLLAYPAYGVEFSIKSALSRYEVTVGDKLEYIITVRIPEEYKGKLFYYPVKTGNFKATTTLNITNQAVDADYHEYYFTTWIAIYDTGTYKIPGSLFELRTPDKIIKKTSPSLTVNVISVLPEDKTNLKIKDIKEFFKKKIKNKKGGFSMKLIILGLIILAIGWYIWGGKSRQQPVKEAKKEDKTIKGEAKKKLRVVEKKGFLEKGDFKSYYDWINDTLRTFLGELKSFNAMDSTTVEISKCLKEKNTNEETIKQIESLFEECDMVKFAKFLPKVKDAENALDKAVNIVDIA